MPEAEPVLEPVLEIDGLHLRFGALEAVRGASLTVRRGETHCLVGESGCGKSVTALAAMALLPRGATRTAGAIRFEGQDIATLPDRAMNRLRGARIGMIFQDPMTSLNPAYTIGSQMTEIYRRHRPATRTQAQDHAAALLSRVGMANPGLRLGQFPHQLSGGLRQRVMIAMALLCTPTLLIADEPTTALDVTVQAGILRLLATLQAEMGLALLLITHDLGIVARIADQVSVMYAGQVVEHAPVAALFANPAHPYTRGLLASVPVPGKNPPRRKARQHPRCRPPHPPGFIGCAFRDRCPQAMPPCALEAPLRHHTQTTPTSANSHEIPHRPSGLR